MAPKRTRRNKKQKGGVLTYEQKKEINAKYAEWKRASELRRANASTNLVVRQAARPPGEQWRRTLAATLPNTTKRQRKNSNGTK